MQPIEITKIVMGRKPVALDKLKNPSLKNGELQPTSGGFLLHSRIKEMRGGIQVSGLSGRTLQNGFQHGLKIFLYPAVKYGFDCLQVRWFFKCMRRTFDDV